MPGLEKSATVRRRSLARPGPLARSGWILVLLVFSAAAVIGPQSWAAGRRAVRPYLHLRLGRSFFTKPDSVSGAQLETPSGQPAFGATIGVEAGKYWGLELAGDYVKTDLTGPGAGKLGDYSLWTLLAQARLRFPLRNPRLVPYLLAGGGVGFGEFSGRENFTVPVGGSDLSPLGVLGGGLEYFAVDNIALAFEAKHSFLFRPEITLNGAVRELDADSVAVTAGMRLYLDSLAGERGLNAGRRAPARDGRAFRGYLALRAGAALFTEPGTVSGLDTENPSGVLAAAAVGVNVNAHLGAELAYEYTRSQLTSPTLGKVAGYPIWTILGLVRLRFPTMDGRLSPYLLAGGGLGYGQMGDADIPAALSGFQADTDTALVGAVGGGFDYFLERNVALTAELRHTFGFDTEVTLNGRSAELGNDFISFTAGVRIFFP